MWSHSLSVSITKMKKLLSSFTFALSFLFFSFFFSKSKHLIITMASLLGIMLHISWSLRWTMLALRVSLIHQNQTRAFNLPLFSNWWQPLHKDMNWNLIESMLLVQAYLLCVKGYGQVSWTPYGSNCSPTYVLRVWIEACTYA